MKKFDVVIIGAGIAGLSIADFLSKNNEKLKILILEKEIRLGGVLNMSEKNYDASVNIGDTNAILLIDNLRNRLSKTSNITIMLETVAVAIKNKTVVFISKTTGLDEAHSRVIISASGAIEKTQGVLNIPGFRPSGVYTAGNIQYELYNGERFDNYHNIVVYGLSPSSQAVIRNLSELGKNITLVIHNKNLCVGNICTLATTLYDSNKVVNISGKEKITSISIAQCDQTGKIASKDIKNVDCDLLILGCGYLPFIPLLYDIKMKMNAQTSGPVFDKNNYSTNKKGIYACGDSLYIHSSVQDICIECEKIGKMVLEYLGKIENDIFYYFANLFGMS